MNTPVIRAVATCRGLMRVAGRDRQFDGSLARGGTTVQVAAAFAQIVAEMGEPFVSRFHPAEIDRLLREHGFGEIVDFGPHEARAAYFQGRAGVDIAAAQRPIAATVMPDRAADGQRTRSH